MSTTDDRQLAAALAQVARRLAGARELESSLQAILESAVEEIPGAELGGISYLQGSDRVAVRLQSDPLVAQIDDAQNATQQGPCLQVLKQDERVVVDDLLSDERWPALSAAIADKGVRSVLSIRLHLERTTGALSMFARTPQAFSTDSAVIAELFATHAAIALAGLEREQHLNRAVRSRDIIGMAKGMIMAEHGMAEQDAFAALVQLSQTENLKLLEVATRLVERGRPSA